MYVFLYISLFIIYIYIYISYTYISFCIFVCIHLVCIYVFVLSPSSHIHLTHNSYTTQFLTHYFGFGFTSTHIHMDRSYRALLLLLTSIKKGSMIRIKGDWQVKRTDILCYICVYLCMYVFVSVCLSYTSHTHRFHFAL